MEWSRDGFVVTCDRAGFDLDVIADFLRSSYWARGIPRETVARSLQDSLGFALLHANRQPMLLHIYYDYHDDYHYDYCGCCYCCYYECCYYECYYNYYYKLYY